MQAIVARVLEQERQCVKFSAMIVKQLTLLPAMRPSILQSTYVSKVQVL